jgi:hypothetical protein
MVKILSFDIGIRNLAYIYIDIENINNFNIIDWNVIDILDNKISDSKIQTKINCYNNGCVKPCYYILDNNTYSCQIHGKKIDNKKELNCSQLMTNGNPCKSKIVKKDEDDKYYCVKHSLISFHNLECNNLKCTKKISLKCDNEYYCKIHSKSFLDKKEIICHRKGKK